MVHAIEPATLDEIQYVDIESVSRYHGDHSGSKGGDSTCYNCNQSDHIAKACPNPKSEPEHKSKSFGDKTCYSCGQVTIQARSAPTQKSNTVEYASTTAMFRAIALGFNATLAHRRNIKASIVQRSRCPRLSKFETEGPCLDRAWDVRRGWCHR